MVLEIGANARQVDLDFNTSALEKRLSAYFTQHGDLWSVYGAGRKDDFMAGADSPRMGFLVIHRDNPYASRGHIFAEEHILHLGSYNNVVIVAVDIIPVAGTGV